MKAQRDDFDKQIAEMNARIRKMEDILNFQIGSRRYLLDLIDYINEMEEKKSRHLCRLLVLLVTNLPLIAPLTAYKS